MEASGRISLLPEELPSTRFVLHVCALYWSEQHSQTLLKLHFSTTINPITPTTKPPLILGPKL